MATAITCDICGKICVFNDGAGTLHFSGNRIVKLDLCAAHGNKLLKWIEGQRIETGSSQT